MTNIPFSAKPVALDIEPQTSKPSKRPPVHIATFEEIFEHDAQWLMGRQFLTNLIEHVKGKPLLARYNPDHPDILNISVPMPTVRDEISGETVSAIFMVPEDLLEILLGCLSQAISAYLNDDDKHRLEEFLLAPTNQLTISSVQTFLAIIERSRQAAAQDELWQVVAEYVGLKYEPMEFKLEVRT